jgi:broad specificity phosphatase PhoE
VEVPERLRRFHCGDWTAGPVVFLDDRFMAAFARWRQARRVWEREHGVTLAELDDRVWATADRAGTLEALGEAAAFIDDEQPDPRCT